ncbi:MAG: hypothetical protein ABIB71_00910 [Candidatus Woesearchaeota archaeon]
MQGLSKKEIEIVSWLEFYKKYFFTADDISRFAKNKTQRYNIIKGLKKKKRIIKLNRYKYYLVPIKAKSGSWSEHPFIIADEICNGKNYFIGGWTAANYWRLTDQIPYQIDIWTTQRQGKIKLFNVRIVFHRTTRRKANQSLIQKIGEHTFRIQNKVDSRKWIKSRN